MSTRGLPISAQPLRLVVATSLFLFIPFAAVGYVAICLATGDFQLRELSILIIFLTLSLLGTGLGFHRYFAHRSFTASRGLKIALGILGCAGGLGPISWFAAIHRRHHRFTDTEKDPHAPHLDQPGINLLTEAWMSAFGFSYRFALHALHLAKPETDSDGISREFRASVRDLTNDPDIGWIERRYTLWVLIFFLIPGLALYSVTGISQDFWNGVIWGGVARMGCNQLIFGFINVAAHRRGAQPYTSSDESRNLYWFAPFSGGESLHNNHHAFPWTAKSGLAWWQIDVNYYFLVLFVKLGWASNVRLPSPAQLAKKRR
jgi:stearoyl-CoA desaturase (delta-9 desaturase)